MRIADLRHSAVTVLLLPVAVAAAAGLAGCTSADLPEPSQQGNLSGGPWATQANAACTETAASLTRPAGEAAGVDVLSWHQNLVYMLASRLSAVPDPGTDGQAFLDALHKVGSSTEALVTALQAKPVDEQARGKADAARTAAIGKAASLSSQLGLTACTTLVAGG